MAILILEDSPKDLRLAIEVARSAGFIKIEKFQDLCPAIDWVKRGLQREYVLPRAVILDLDLGLDSGYEFLRFWHSTRSLSKIRLVVWTSTEQRNRDICSLFGVEAYVNKWEGEDALRNALEHLFDPIALVG